MAHRCGAEVALLQLGRLVRMAEHGPVCIAGEGSSGRQIPIPIHRKSVAFQEESVTRANPAVVPPRIHYKPSADESIPSELNRH